MYSVLIVAYRRHSEVSKILQACVGENIEKVYVHVDAARDIDATFDVTKVIQVVETFADSSQLDISILHESLNQGSAVSLISTCDLIFKNVENLVILEDDCIPGDSFFTFAKEAFDYMKVHEEVALFCGSQFAPVGLTNEPWLLSKYPFQWGWGTNQKSWRKIRAGLVGGSKLSKINSNTPLTFWERSYWNAGCRRALQGFSDVWDTLYVREMLRHGLSALLPGKNLVQNVGNDQFALHTDSFGNWNNLPVHNFLPTDSKPLFNLGVDRWIRKTYFGISLRHYATTKVTRIRDFLKRNPGRMPLNQRIN